MEKRDFVRPEDIAELYISAVSHRVSLSRDAIASGLTAETVLADILKTTKVPFLTGAGSK